MALTKEDLQAIGAMMDSKLSAALEPMKAEMDKMREAVEVIRASQLIVELEHLPRIQIALDAIEAGNDKSKAQDKRIGALEHKTDEHDVRLFALEHAVNT